MSSEMTQDQTQEYYSDEFSTFGDRMTAARRAAGLTQEQFAKKLGIKHKTVISWENDFSEPRANRIQMMAGLLNVSLSWLLTGEGEGGAEISHPEQMITGVKAELISEMREIRGQLKSLLDRLGRLEKRLTDYDG